MRQQTLWLTCLLGAALVACSDDEDPQPSPTDEEVPIEVPERLSAMIGPEGGEIVGPANTAWAFVRVTVPAGALAAATDVTVEPTVDPLPLAGDAERIGPQFRIGPEGTELAAPITVTLPFDFELRHQFDLDESECRIWYRDGDGWMNAEQTASTPDAVTVQLDRFTTAAVGAFVTSRGTVCPPSGCLPATECLAGSGYCLTRLPNPTAVPFETNSLRVTGGGAYYVTSPATNTFTVARYDITGSSHAQTRYVQLSAAPTGTVAVRGEIAIEDDGDAWVGLGGYGNVRFAASAPPFLNETVPSLTPLGVVIDPFSREPVRLLGQVVTSTVPNPDGTLTTLTFQRVRGIEGTLDWRIFLAEPGEPFVALQRRDIAVIAPGVLGHEQFFRARTRTHTLRFSTGIAQEGTLGVTTSPPFRLHVEVAEGSYMVADSPSVGGPGFSRPLPFIPSSIAVDDDEYIYAVDSTRPQIVIVDRDGGQATLNLTSAAMGTTEYDQRVARVVRYVPETDSLFVITKCTGASGRLFFTLSNLAD